MIEDSEVKQDNFITQRTSRVWLTPESCDLEDFKVQINRVAKTSDYPCAARIEKNVPIYDCNSLRQLIKTDEDRKAVMAEWAEIFLSGPGIVVLKGATTDMQALDMMSADFKPACRRSTSSGSMPSCRRFSSASVTSSVSWARSLVVPA